MASQAQDIAALVESLVISLVEHKDEVQVTFQDSEDEGLLIEVSVHEEDAGKVIGRAGRVIKSIRTLARAAASRSNIPVDVELLD